MAKTITIDPITRIEGHLSISTDIEDGKVVDAKVAGRMYRGFEQLLIGRHPVDAARITQRICGICHEVHGIAASIAIENLYNLTPSYNGLVLRDLILGLHVVTDHLLHFYQLTLPDYLNFSLLRNYKGNDSRIIQAEKIFRSSSGTFSNKNTFGLSKDINLTTEMALSYINAINVRKEAGSGLASIGGKVPFCHAILPGGVTTKITADRLVKYSHALKVTADFINREYLPQAIALADEFSHYFDIGKTYGNFYCNGGFTLLKSPMYNSGISTPKGDVLPANFDKIDEFGDSSYLSPNGEIDTNKKGAYSWVRGILYDGAPMEVGPLARLAINSDDDFIKTMKRFNPKFNQRAIKSSVMSRIIARAYEAQKICNYLQKLLPLYHLDEPTMNSLDLSDKTSGSGLGMSIASRGAVNHHITTQEGKVVGYKLQVPSAWNFGPTTQGQRGVVEESLIGTSISQNQNFSNEKKESQGANSIEIARIVRSFDPCLACAIH